MGIPEVLFHCTPAKNQQRLLDGEFDPGEAPLYLAELEGAAKAYAINQHIGAEDEEFILLEVFTAELEHALLAPFTMPIFDRGKTSYTYPATLRPSCFGKIERFICPGRPNGWMNAILNGKG